MSTPLKDAHNRLRSRTIAFRVSPEEDENIKFVINLSGMTKQDYIISKLLDRSIIVKGNCKVYRGIYDRLGDLLAELKRIDAGQSIDEDLMSSIKLITSLTESLTVESKE